MSPSWLYLTGHLQGLPTSADSQLWIMPALQILLSGSFLVRGLSCPGLCLLTLLRKWGTVFAASRDFSKIVMFWIEHSSVIEGFPSMCEVLASLLSLQSKLATENLILASAKLTALFGWDRVSCSAGWAQTCSNSPDWLPCLSAKTPLVWSV